MPTFDLHSMLKNSHITTATCLKCCGSSSTYLPAYPLCCILSSTPLINRKENYLDYLTKTFDEFLRQYPHAAFIIGGDFNDFDTGAIESSLGIHSVFTGVTHKRPQLDYVMVLQKAPVKQCFSMKTTIKTDHLALVVKPRVPIPTVRRKVSSVINDITKDAN